MHVFAGECSFGDRCRFLHGKGASTRGSKLKNSQPCYALRDEGTCKFGADCRYSHDKEALSEAGTQSAPRQGKKPAGKGACYRWADNKSCEYGDECRFEHGECCAWLPLLCASLRLAASDMCF